MDRQTDEAGDRDQPDEQHDRPDRGLCVHASMLRARGGRSRALGALAASIAQEPLDLRDEVVAGRQPLLVDHRLEPLDVRPRRLLERGRRVEPLAELARLLGQPAVAEVGPDVPADRVEQGDGRRRVGPEM